MSKQHKYLVTTDADTGELIRVERLGSTGELVEVPADTLPGLQAAARLSPAPEQAEARGDEPEYAPGVFIESGLRELEGEPEYAPGVFIESGLRELEDEPEPAPGVYTASKLPETHADAQS